MRTSDVSDQDLQKVFVQYARSIKWIEPVAISLTMKQRVFDQKIDMYFASANFRHFMNRLNRKVFGNAAHRFGRGLKVLPVQEHNELVRLHYHGVIDKPQRMSFDEFRDAINAAWQRTAWGYKQTAIEPIRNDGWHEYLAKLRQKPQYDLAFDWVNVRTT